MTNEIKKVIEWIEGLKTHFECIEAYEGASECDYYTEILRKALKQLKAVDVEILKRETTQAVYGFCSSSDEDIEMAQIIHATIDHLLEQGFIHPATKLKRLESALDEAEKSLNNVTQILFNIFEGGSNYAPSEMERADALENAEETLQTIKEARDEKGL